MLCYAFSAYVFEQNGFNAFSITKEKRVWWARFSFFSEPKDKSDTRSVAFNEVESSDQSFARM